ncbi:MAG TPA: hypothetical protein GXZ95_04185 [Mollicutes bacterium]|nr:hypothetical protein [Mollicutes bacterium]
MDELYISLPVVLYVLGIILLIILIILGIRLLKMMSKIDSIINDVDDKVKSLNGVFEIIDVATDRLSFVTDRVVEFISNFFMKLFKKKEKEDIIDE